ASGHSDTKAAADITARFRRAIASCESRHGTRFHSPQRGCVISPVGGVPSSLFYLEVPMKCGRSLVELAQELERQLATKKDMVVPSSLMLYRTSEQGVSSVDIDEQTGVQTYGITELARRQLADKLKIPYAYFERMRAEQPHLLDRNVNTWLPEDDADKRLIRTLDGRVRAVLSDRYRRLDNFDLAENVLPILQRLPEARFESVELTELR